ncbi:hypothetical protein AVME950_11685 [Acidovorax sp. SUPP950]|uniref:hypothetical protein n=1 Tax=Acidovorax sp. SUPP950 TaxID=511901 RepID=UPI0023CCF388|nr:hypothetical protein [Acidovorax sp. SUPP950]GKS75555.1 hypothetical protein AVME950_11685 [Acidovorax sp. SUPP950]
MSVHHRPLPDPWAREAGFLPGAGAGATSGDDHGVGGEKMIEIKKWRDGRILIRKIIFIIFKFVCFEPNSGTIHAWQHLFLRSPI